jgi:hypothetical protein
MSRVTLIPVFALLVAGPGPAEDKPASKVEKIEVRVLSIMASEHKPFVHDKLTAFAEEVRKTDKKLIGFRLEKAAVESIPLGETTKFKLPGGEVLEVTPNKPMDANGRVTLTVKPPNLTAVTYECVCGKYVPMATQQHVGKGKEKEQLFIAVSAKPCGLKK